MTMTDTSSNDYDNPWETAANDQSWNVGGGGGTQVEGSGSSTPSHRDAGAAEPTSGSRGMSMYMSPSSSLSYRCLQVCHILDIGLALSLVTYTLMNVWQHQHQDGLAIALFTLSGIWLTRGILSRTHCGLRLSASLSLLFCMLYAIVSLVAWIVYWKNDHASLLPISVLEDHPKALPSFLLALAILESVRWAWIQQYFQQIEFDLLLDNNDDDDFANTTRGPSWWQRRRTIIEEPLLNSNNDRPHWSSNNSRAYQMDDGVGGAGSSPRRSMGGWWPFSSSGNGNENVNVRDDGSVDYASLNEDWASRSEEDPHWWTQE